MKTINQKFPKFCLVVMNLIFVFAVSEGWTAPSQLENRVLSTNYDEAFQALAEAKSQKNIAALGAGVRNREYGVQFRATEYLVEMNQTSTIPYLIEVWTKLNQLQPTGGTEIQGQFDALNQKMIRRLAELIQKPVDQSAPLNYDQMLDVISKANAWLTVHPNAT